MMSADEGGRLARWRHLTGRRVLVVEDEFLIADDIAAAFARVGIETVGPVKTVERALSLIEGAGHLDGAVLDINLQGEMVYPVIDALERRGVPYVFATGYERQDIPARYQGVPRCEKPLDAGQVVNALFP
jgi:CheY-like chemotaxis protein